MQSPRPAPMLDIPALLANKPEAQLRAALEHLMAVQAQPVFGADKQVEHEVAALTVNLDLPQCPWETRGVLEAC